MPASRAVHSGLRQNGDKMQQPMKVWGKPPFFLPLVFALAFLTGLFLCPNTSAATIFTGSGTNSCTLLLNFSSGDKLSFTHRFNGISILAQNALENVIMETGGSLLTTGYLTDFSTALSQLTTSPQGLVVQYQSSMEYPDPYINGILWTPTGATNGDYLGEFDWWQIWVQGAAELAQPYNEPPDPLILTTESGWISPPASGLKDISLGNGAYFGLVYGSAVAPTSSTPPPAPIVRSTRFLSGNQLEITFETIPGVYYVLKSNPQLVGNSWTSISTFVASSTNQSVAVPMTHPTGRQFFRLEVMP